MMKHISKIKAMVRELTEMGKTFTEQDTVDLIFTSLPDAGPDNWNSIINNLRPSPNHEVKLKTVVSTLLNEEEKRRKLSRHRRDFRRQDGRRHQRREEQHRDQLDRDRKRPHVDDPSDPNKVEVSAVDTKSAKYHGRGPEGDGLKYCFICKTRGNHVGQDHDDYDPNYRKKSGRQVTKISIKKPRTRRDTDSDTETDINVNAVATTTDTKQPLLKDSHWTLDNGATGHVTGSRSAITSWHGATDLVLPDGSRIAAKMGSAKIRLTEDGTTTTLKLHDVAYHPGIYKNLLSHARLLKSGYHVHRQDSKQAVYVHNTTGHELRFKMSNNLVFFDGRAV